MQSPDAAEDAGMMHSDCCMCVVEYQEDKEKHGDDLDEMGNFRDCIEQRVPEKGQRECTLDKMAECPPSPRGPSFR